MTLPVNRDELCRQLRMHLRSLGMAGIDWVPVGPHLEMVASPQSVPPMRASAVPATTPAAEALGEARPLCEGPPPSLTIGNEALPGPPVASIDERRIALTQLAAEVRACTKCPELCSTRTQTVFGDGVPGVELCFVGEAPGEDEDRQGVPFVGAAGQLLNRIIAGCGLKREDVYIMNILRCRPPRNRTPLPNEAANCRGFLERQMDLVQPKFIVALGSCAATNLLQTTLSIGKLRGRFHDYRGIPVLVTYHPAYLLPHRSPEKKREVWEDMKTVLRRMGRPIPEVKKG